MHTSSERPVSILQAAAGPCAAVYLLKPRNFGELAGRAGRDVEEATTSGLAKAWHIGHAFSSTETHFKSFPCSVMMLSHRLQTQCAGHTMSQLHPPPRSTQACKPKSQQRSCPQIMFFRTDSHISRNPSMQIAAHKKLGAPHTVLTSSRTLSRA